MKQYELIGESLNLKVKKAPLFIRGMMFVFAFLLFVGPFIGLFLFVASGNGFHISFAIGIFISGLLGFYLLRVALWNTYGTETLTLSKSKIDYIADYGWFKDGKKQLEIDNTVVYSIQQIGYLEDEKGLLTISTDESQIICVTKIPNEQLNELIEVLNNS